MISVLLGVLGCYVVAAAVIHWCSVLRRRRGTSAKHYVLIARNEAHRMEWYMRSLQRFSHLTGTDVKVTVVDGGSDDETMRIAEAFRKKGMVVRVHAGADERGAPVEQGWREEREERGERQHLRDRQGGQGGQERQAIDEQAAFSGEAGNGGMDCGDGESGKGRDDGAPVRDHSASSASQVAKAKPIEAAQLLWQLQAEGIVSVKEHAVLVDLQNPADLSKLPF